MADAALNSVLASAQRIGLIGAGSLSDAVAHAQRYVALVPAQAELLVDLGSGGGLPGLVIAARREDLQVVLVERRIRAADLLVQGIAAMGIESRVRVLARDAVDVGHDPQWRGRADVVTGRSVAPPPRLAELAMPLLRPGGVLIVSAADRGETWPDALPEVLGSGTVTRHDGLVVATLQRLRGASPPPPSHPGAVLTDVQLGVPRETPGLATPRLFHVEPGRTALVAGGDNLRPPGRSSPD